MESSGVGGQNFAFRQVWWSYRSLPNYGSLICTFVLCGFFVFVLYFAIKKKGLRKSFRDVGAGF